MKFLSTNHRVRRQRVHMARLLGKFQLGGHGFLAGHGNCIFAGFGGIGHGLADECAADCNSGNCAEKNILLRQTELLS